MRRLSLLLASLGCLSVAACSSTSDPASGKDAGGGGMEAGPDCAAFESDADLVSPTVSFTTDVLPTFQRSCGIAGSTCHGAPDEMASQQRPYLGLFDGGTDGAVVISGIVGVNSFEDPQAIIVKASDPTDSYMMHKLDGDQCLLATQCAKGTSQYPTCGTQMPFESGSLPQLELDNIRRWIAQGAKNN
jgi:hypothetical protein